MATNFSNQTYFMTGGTSGFGKVVVCYLANKGARVVVLARNLEKGKLLQAEYQQQYSTGKGSIELVEGDLSSMRSTITAARQVKKQYKHLDGLLLNAGIWNSKFKETEDGIEETLQVNLLAPLILSHLLFETLEESYSPKIIITSSGLHQGVINFENIEFRKGYSVFKVYRQSKLGVILLSRLLAKRLADSPVKIYNQHPGFVATSLGRDSGWFARLIFKTFGKSPEKGAETLIHLLDTPNSDLTNGEFYAKSQVTRITPESNDLEMAERLMDVCRIYLKPYLEEPSPIFPKV